jgi:flagellar motor switch/type III secretory pathway protein FliN
MGVVPAQLGADSVELRVKLGSASLDSRTAAALAAGALVPLDQFTTDVVEVFADDVLIARGQLVAYENSYCVRVTETMAGTQHRRAA